MKNILSYGVKGTETAGTASATAMTKMDETDAEGDDAPQLKMLRVMYNDAIAFLIISCIFASMNVIFGFKSLTGKVKSIHIKTLKVLLAFFVFELA